VKLRRKLILADDQRDHRASSETGSKKYIPLPIAEKKENNTTAQKKGKQKRQ